MDVNEILAEIEKLSPNELDVIQAKLESLQAEDDFEATPEMLAAIQEGRRSLREEGGIPLEDVIKVFES